MRCSDRMSRLMDGKKQIEADSLSIVLPVCNARDSVRRDVLRIFELMGQESVPFELILVDNASTDSTVEELHDLAQTYPQIRLVLFVKPVSEDKIARRAMELAVTEFLVVCEQNRSLPLDEFQRLWQLRHEPGLVAARCHSILRAASSSPKCLAEVPSAGSGRRPRPPACLELMRVDSVHESWRSSSSRLEVSQEVYRRPVRLGRA